MAVVTGPGVGSRAEEWRGPTGGGCGRLVGPPVVTFLHFTARSFSTNSVGLSPWQGENLRCLRGQRDTKGPPKDVTTRTLGS